MVKNNKLFSLYFINYIINYSDYPNCNQIDYLNFHCNACGKNLCKNHYHHELSCPFAKTKEENKNKVDFNYQITKCDFCKGTIKNMDPVQCEFCKKYFCLKHKLESDHDCPSTKKISIEDKHKKNKEYIKQKMAEMKRKKGS